MSSRDHPGLIRPDTEPAVNLRASQIAELCVAMLATEDGLTADKKTNDFGGVDLDITVPLLGDSNPEDLVGDLFSIQVKSVRRDTQGLVYCEDDRSYTYPLKVKNYNLLRRERLIGLPYFLAVVIMPRGNRWVTQSINEVALECERFLVDLRGRPRSDNKRTKNIPLHETDRMRPGMFTAIANVILEERGWQGC